MKSVLLALTLVLSSASAFAGDWHYGCVGQIDAQTNVMFNRDKIVLSSSQLQASKLLKLQGDSIQTLTSDDINSGLEKKMTFSNKWPDGTVEQLVLDEVSSKSTGNSDSTINCTDNRVREISHETTDRKYNITLPGAKAPVTAVLKCYNYIVSTCG